MTAAELIEILEELDPSTEVRLATQPSWPFEHSISRFYAITDREGEEQIFYLAEQEQLGYLSGDISMQLGWA
jgi:hypothetical protein